MAGKATGKAAIVLASCVGTAVIVVGVGVVKAIKFVGQKGIRG
jgi:hypothetical protein